MVIYRAPDHMMVVADVPIDTAGSASTRAKLWNRHTNDRWVRDVSDLGKMEPEKVKQMNKKLKNSKPQSSSFAHLAEWYMKAARGTVHKKRVTKYPERPHRIKNITAQMRKIQFNLKRLHTIRTRLQRHHRPSEIMKSPKTQLKVVAGTMFTTQLKAMVEATAYESAAAL